MCSTVVSIVLGGKGVAHNKSGGCPQQARAAIRKTRGYREISLTLDGLTAVMHP